MKIEKIIKDKLYFLIDKKFSYNYICENKLFWEYKFYKDEYVVSLIQDIHNEFLDILIKHKTDILLKTNYQFVVIDTININKQEFKHILKSIYSLPHNTYSLSKGQIINLIDLYTDCINKFANHIC